MNFRCNDGGGCCSSSTVVTGRDSQTPAEREFLEFAEAFEYVDEDTGEPIEFSELPPRFFGRLTFLCVTVASIGMLWRLVPHFRALLRRRRRTS